MPLKRLWNSLCGRSPQGPTPVEESAAHRDTASDRQASVKPRGKPSSVKPTNAKRGGFNLFGGPHTGLCKQIKSLQAATNLEIATVLEIGVGDGSRAIAMLSMIESAGEKARYFAIDQFELAGGEVTLKHFHQTLRTANIRPQVLPQPIAPALMRMAHTHGEVDLIVIGAPTSQWQNPAAEAALARVAHARTAIVFSDGDSWIRYQVPGVNSVRRAA